MLVKIILLIGKNALFIFNNKNKEVLQIVEFVLIAELPNFNLSSGFYGLPDYIASDIVSELHIPSYIFL